MQWLHIFIVIIIVMSIALITIIADMIVVLILSTEKVLPLNAEKSKQFNAMREDAMKGKANVFHRIKTKGSLLLVATNHAHFNQFLTCMQYVFLKHHAKGFLGVNI